jgi:acyl-CoA thioesterase FadM
MLPEYGFAAVSDDPLPLEAYPHRRAIPTRWRDNDVYGHVNNVEYYSYFVHVFVDRASRRPVAIPDPLRSALAALASS